MQDKKASPSPNAVFFVWSNSWILRWSNWYRICRQGCEFVFNLGFVYLLHNHVFLLLHVAFHSPPDSLILRSLSVAANKSCRTRVMAIVKRGQTVFSKLEPPKNWPPNDITRPLKRLSNVKFYRRMRKPVICKPIFFFSRCGTSFLVRVCGKILGFFHFPEF